MADSAAAFRTDREVRVATVFVDGAFRALSTISSSATEWRFAPTAYVAIKDTGLTLTLVALTETGLSTIGRIPTTHTENTELLHRTER